MTANRIHPKHNDSMFAGEMHFIACFKDVMLEVVCRDFEEVKIGEEYYFFCNILRNPTLIHLTDWIMSYLQQ